MKNKKIFLISLLILPALAILAGCGTKSQPAVVNPVPTTTTPATTPSSTPSATGQVVVPSGGSDEITTEANQIDADLNSIDDNSFSETGLDDVDQ
jgi:uncharacterized lipoprotein YajG